jgi:hypothetical protein
MKKAITLLAALASAVLVLSLVWMNRYHYQQAAPEPPHSWQIVRANRFTGKVCYSQQDGTWNSNLNPPPEWLDAYMRYGLVPAPSGKENPVDKALGFIPDPAPLTEAELKRRAEKYTVNTCR